jgi:outer membrane protein assembly factor BamB
MLPARPIGAWQTFVQDVPSSNGEARDVATDPADDVFAVGLVTGFTAVKLAGESGAELWRRTITGTGPATGQARAVASAPNGDAIVAGSVSNTGTGSDFLVSRLAGLDGSDVWRRDLDGTSGFGEEARDVATDSLGDVVAAGRLDNSETFWDFTVVKLDRASGSELWRYEKNGTASVSEEARALVVDSDDDVLATGLIRNGSTGSDLAVVKLAGGSGAELWRREIDGGAARSDEGLAITVDDAGDVLVAGFVTNPSTSRDLAVFKLSGSDGSTLWSYEADGGASGDDRATGISLDASGRVFAGGRLVGTSTDADAAVVALDGATGAVLWTYRLDGPAGEFDEALGISPGPAGDPVVVGFVSGETTSRDLLAARIDAASGTEVWRQQINGSASGADSASSVVPIANGSGDVVVGGAIWRMTRRGPIREKDPSQELTVIRLDGQDGSDLRMTAGRRLNFIDRNNFEARQELTIVSFDPISLVPPVRGSPSDPRSTSQGGSGAGGRIVLRNPTTGEEDTFELPAQHWDAIGTDRNPRGYRYRDTGQVSGPCRLVSVRVGRRLQAKCLGGGISFTRSTSPARGASPRWCRSARPR